MSLNLRSTSDQLLVVFILTAGVLGGFLLRPWITGRTHDRKGQAVPAAPAGPDHPQENKQSQVTALGRLRPGRGVVKVAGPSQPAVVVGKLLVDEGDRVQRGQTIALLDNHLAQIAVVDRLSANVEAQSAEVAKIEAELRTGMVEYARLTKLHKQGAISDSQRDAAELAAESAGANLRRARAGTNLARADLRRAREDLQLTVVRAPVNGQVLKIHTREGERAGVDGIVEIADTGQMYAVAEVYETDISRVVVGQRATVSLPRAGAPLSGMVERIGLKIGKVDVLGTDPVARTDARVVEVDIRLDDSSRVSGVTNMQVTVTIDVANRQAAAVPKLP